MKKLGMFIAAAFTIAAAMTANAASAEMVLDQCKREELFFKCMQMVPKGPDSTKYNDWDEVVAECGQQVYYLAHRPLEQVKPECQWR